MQRALVSASVMTLLLTVAACSSDTSSSGASDPTSDSSTGTTEPAAADPSTTTTQPAPTVPASSTPTSAPATTAPPTTTAPTTPGTTGPVPSTTGAPTDPDQELARSILITLDDFPEGWEETPDDTDDDTEQEAELDACLGDRAYVDGGVLDSLEVTTGDFAPGGASAPTVQHSAVVAPDVDTAAAAMGEVQDPASPDCYAAAIRSLFEELVADPGSGFPAGATLGEVAVDVLPYEADGPEVVSYLVSVPVTADGETITFFYDLFFLRSGRALSQLIFYSVNEPFPEEGVDALVGVTIERIAPLSDA